MKATGSKIATLVKCLGVGFGASLAAPTFAAIIGTFDYTQEFEFVSAAPGGVNMSGGVNPGDVAGWTKLDWGTPSNPANKISSLVINPVVGDTETPDNMKVTGTVTTATDINDMDFELGPVLVHNNFVINGTSLDTATAEDYVVLTSVPPGTVQIQQVMFGVNFLETINAHGSPGQPACEAAPLGGPDTINAFGCGDIFVLDTGDLGTPQLVNVGRPDQSLAFVIDSFDIDGYKYEVFLREISGNIGTLSNKSCAAVGRAAGCAGFTTFENEINRFDLEFSVLATQLVPAPATLFLMSGSLLSLAWFQRRKARKAA